MQQCATEMKYIEKPISLTKLIHKLLFLSKLREPRRVFRHNGIDITWNNDQNIKLVRQLMTGIGSYLRKWHNTVIPPIDIGYLIYVCFCPRCANLAHFSSYSGSFRSLIWQLSVTHPFQVIFMLFSIRNLGRLFNNNLAPFRP